MFIFSYVLERGLLGTGEGKEIHFQQMLVAPKVAYAT